MKRMACVIALLILVSGCATNRNVNRLIPGGNTYLALQDKKEARHTWAAGVHENIPVPGKIDVGALWDAYEDSDNTVIWSAIGDLVVGLVWGFILNWASDELNGDSSSDDLALAAEAITADAYRDKNALEVLGSDNDFISLPQERAFDLQVFGSNNTFEFQQAE